MPNIGAGEILVILLVALLVLGPDKLPGAARSAGRAMGQIRRLSHGFEQEVRNAMHSVDPTSSSPPTTRSTPPGVHPGLGPGPKLTAGSVDLGGPSATDTGDAVRAPSDGPTESFS